RSDARPRGSITDLPSGARVLALRIVAAGLAAHGLVGARTAPHCFLGARDDAVVGSHVLVHDAGHGRDLIRQQLTVWGRQIHEPHALGVAANHRDPAHRHADHLARTSDDYQLVAIDDLLDGDEEAVPIGGLDRDDPLPA